MISLTSSIFLTTLMKLWHSASPFTIDKDHNSSLGPPITNLPATNLPINLPQNSQDSSFYARKVPISWREIQSDACRIVLHDKRIGYDAQCIGYACYRIKLEYNLIGYAYMRIL